MKKEEKISVIIPTYNREKLISRSINSVLNQTYKNIEVIVIDDASTDNTEKVIKDIKDERIKYIKLKKNKGACHARNIGIKEATGKYIAFQDSDDLFKEDKLYKQYNNLIKNKSDFDFCKLMLNDGNNKIVVPNSNQEEFINNNKILDGLCFGNFISTQTILIKTDLAKKILFDENMPRLQDYDFVLRIAKRNKISYTNEILVELYRQNDSISTSYDKLRNAIILFLEKDYNLNKIQRRNLNKWLLENYSSDIEVIQGLNNQVNELNARYEEIYKIYTQIINSKRWKLISKILDRKK